MGLKINWTSERYLQVSLFFFSILTYCICLPQMWHLYFPQDDGYTIRKQLFGDDFVNMWAGARLYMTGQVESIYDPAQYHQKLKALLHNPTYPIHNFSYPPHLLMFVSGLSFLTYFQGLLLWSLCGLAAVTLFLKSMKVNWLWIIIVLSSPAVVANLMMGQNGLFTSVLLVGGLILSRDRPMLAGVLIGLLTMKPQLGILIPFVLILTRNWKCFISAALTTSLFVGLSVVLMGIDPWQEYLTKTFDFQVNLMTQELGYSTYYQFLMPGIFMTGSLVIEPLRHLFENLHSLVAVIVFIKILLIVRIEKQLTPKNIFGICLSLPLITPYYFNYDILSITLAMTFYFIYMTRDKLTAKTSSYVWILLMMLWTLPLTTIVMRANFTGGIDATLSHFFLFPPFILAAAFYMLFFRKNEIILKDNE